MTNLEHLAASAEGYYVGILESYGIRWSFDKVVRDAWQNFFDEGSTLDGIHYVHIKQPRREGDLFGIYGRAYYDWRKLVHLGGTSKKIGGTSAGGFGEGGKVLALCLLRDFKFDRVVFAAGAWRLEFVLQAMPKDTYDTPMRGLFAKLTKAAEPVDGNYLMLKTRDYKRIPQLVEGRNFFYHSCNPDFLNPSVVVKVAKPGLVGIKALESIKSKGQLYDAGQMRQYSGTESNDSVNDEWCALEGMALWSLGYSLFPPDRDRGSVDWKQLDQAFVKQIIPRMSKQQIVDLIMSLKFAWPAFGIMDVSAARLLLIALLNAGKQHRLWLRFPGNCVAYEIGASLSLVQSTEAAGFKVCHRMFAELGMKRMSQLFADIGSERKVSPTKQEQGRISVLMRATLEINQWNNGRKRFTAKPIYLYDGTNSPIVGQYATEHVWMARSELAKSFERTLATYLHELDHQYGTDQSAEFSYALTDTIEAVLYLSTAYSELFSALKREFDEAE